MYLMNRLCRERKLIYVTHKFKTKKHNGNSNLIQQYPKLNLQTLKKIHTSSALLKKETEKTEETSPICAGVIVIGDEILRGQVLDTNSSFIAKHLFNLGITLSRVSIIRDVECEIVDEVRSFCKNFTYVITTGGIGPTHDDITYEAIAKAFNEELVPHPELVEICKKFYKTEDLKAPPMKLAHIPESAKLVYGIDPYTGKSLSYPTVSIRNVYIFPGVPQLMEKQFSNLSKQLFGGSKTKFYMKEIFVNYREIDITPSLNEVVAKFPNVTFGSYPKMSHSYYKVHLTMQSNTEKEVANAYKELKASLPEGSVVQFDKNPLEKAHDKLVKFLKDYKNPQIEEAVTSVMQTCLNYSPEEVYVYFDGTKEATIVLHLFHTLAKMQYADAKIQVVCNYESVDHKTFVNETVARYNLDVEVIDYSPMLVSTLVSHQPAIKAIVIGYQSCNTDAVKYDTIVKNPSNPDEIKCINPLSKWTEPDVWKVIRSLYLPYCKIYDERQQ